MARRFANNRKIPVERLLLPTLLAIVRHSLGSKTYRTYYVTFQGKKFDACKNGVLSCAAYVSSLLLMVGLIKRFHGEVDSTVADLLKSGWKKVRRPKLGSVIVWAPLLYPSGEMHKHIGIYLGNEYAASHSAKKRVPVRHHWTYGERAGKPRQTVEAIYHHDNLKEKEIKKPLKSIR